MENLHPEPQSPNEVPSKLEHDLNETVQPEPGVNTGVNYDRPPEITHGPTHITRTRV